MVRPSKPSRVDRFNYTRPEEIIIITLQCESCKNKLDDPMICTEYVERKPNGVLRAESDCPKYSPIEQR